ncbi:MAG: Xaa-Pro peptidase family protein [Ilumatobacteraceae bacterium]
MTEQLVAHGYDAVVLSDPINIRYATDVSNMQPWTSHSPARYTVVCADGYTVAFEFAGSEHLAGHVAVVDEVRTSRNWFYFAAGERMAANAQMWADEVVDVVRQRCGSASAKIAADRLDPLGLDALRSRSVTVGDGQVVLEQARSIKCPGEVDLLRHSVEVAEAGLLRMHRDSLPGRSENQIWAELHHENICAGGEWIETRLLAIGHRTNPWYQESSTHVGEVGDILAVDTDMIGPNGYCADISRSWTIGHVPLNAIQRDLYRSAVDQIEHNVGVITAGMSFDEFNERSWRIPERFRAGRYGYAFHGIGMADEWPGVATHVDYDTYIGGFEPGMVVSVESLIGEDGGRESVKLETQVVITETGVERLDTYPWEEHA